MGKTFKDISKTFDANNVRMISFGRYHLPIEFFKISVYMFKGLQSSVSRNKQCDLVKLLENPNWWKTKAKEYYKYSVSGNNRDLGDTAFWTNISAKYDGNIKKIQSITGQGIVKFHLDDRNDRRLFLEYLQKEQHEMGDNNSGHYDRWEMERVEKENEKERKKTDEYIRHHGSVVGIDRMNSADPLVGKYDSNGLSEFTGGTETVVHGNMKVKAGEMLQWDKDSNSWHKVATESFVEENFKGKKMNVKNRAITEVKELWNVGGAADIAFGKILYGNIKSAFGKTIVRISFIDKLIGKVNKKMKIKNEVTELAAVLGALVIAKQFYEHKALENVRGYIVNRLYLIVIENTGFDDVLTLINSQDMKAGKEA